MIDLSNLNIILTGATGAIGGEILNKLYKCNSEIINVKAKTADKVGTIGKSKAIACWVTVTITE